jgi:hypothetical protein
MGLLTNCQQCHNGSSWQSVTFNHANIAAGSCVGCHSDQATRANAANPNHAAFGSDCASCHTTRSWSFFHRTSFPMNHRNAGGICANCHLDVTQPRNFDCILCHERNGLGKTKVDQIHLVDKKVRGYTYGNQACYSCHPTGRGG